MPKKNWIKSKVLLPLWRLISIVLCIIVMKPSILGFPQAYGEYGCVGQDSTHEEEEVLSHFNDCINNVSLLDKRLYISADIFVLFYFFIFPLSQHHSFLVRIDPKLNYSRRPNTWSYWRIPSLISMVDRFSHPLPLIQINYWNIFEGLIFTLTYLVLLLSLNI